MADLLTRVPTQAATPERLPVDEAPPAGPRVRLWVELLLIGVGYWAYSRIADGAPRSVTQAIDRTRALLRLEGHLHVAVEHGLNTWWAASHGRIIASNLYYDGMHFTVPVLVLVWMAVWHRRSYRPLRSILLVTSLVGLAAFWVVPVAPPRLVPGAGFVDTVAMVRTIGGGGSHGISSAENPFAAMPSLHVAWAAWSALCVSLLARRAWVRAGVWLHPVLTVFVIMATGNHLLSDAVGGMLALGLAVAAVAGLRGLRHHPGLHSG